MQDAATTEALNRTAGGDGNSKRKPVTVNAVTFLNPKALLAASLLEAGPSLDALEEMFEDAFLYGYHALEEDNILYGFNEREIILLSYREFKALIPVLNRYQWPCSGKTLVKAEDYKLFYSALEDMYSPQQMVSVWEQMMITSILYKYLKNGDHPTDWKRPGNIYQTFAQMRDLIEGYIPERERRNE